MISVCILTKNSEKTIEKTLNSCKTFSEVILLDTGSSDLTLSIARNYPNVSVYKRPFSGFGELRNHLATLASNDWILALDSDEEVSPELIEEFTSLSLDSRFVYSIPRKNFLNKKWIRGCGWWPDRVKRLYNRKKTKFNHAMVHESLEESKTILLKHPLFHTPYRSTEEFLAKMQHYSSLFAEQYKGKRKSSFKKALGHGFFAFFKSYLLKRGFLDGKEGFIISLYNANTAFYKYLKLYELTTFGSPCRQEIHRSKA